MRQPFPLFRKVDTSKIGYIWGVYVRPEHRSKQIGTELVAACMSHLKFLGCGRALLHAGDLSAPLYSRLGFVPTDELSASL